MSSEWFSMRDMADFLVRSFLAIISCVTPARSRACRSITLNSNASYPDSKFSANFGLRFLRRSMYRSRSLMTCFSFRDNRLDVDGPVQFPGVESFAAFSRIHWLRSEALGHRRIRATDNYCLRLVLESPIDCLFQPVSSCTVAGQRQVSRPAGAPKQPSGPACLKANRQIPRRDFSHLLFGRSELSAQTKLTHL